MPFIIRSALPFNELRLKVCWTLLNCFGPKSVEMKAFWRFEVESYRTNERTRGRVRKKERKRERGDQEAMQRPHSAITIDSIQSQMATMNKHSVSMKAFAMHAIGSYSIMHASSGHWTCINIKHIKKKRSTMQTMTSALLWCLPICLVTVLDIEFPATASHCNSECKSFVCGQTIPQQHRKYVRDEWREASALAFSEARQIYDNINNRLKLWKD